MEAFCILRNDITYPSVLIASLLILMAAVYYVREFWQEDTQKTRENLTRAALFVITANLFIILWILVYYLGISRVELTNAKTKYQTNAFVMVVVAH